MNTLSLFSNFETLKMVVGGGVRFIIYFFFSFSVLNYAVLWVYIGVLSGLTAAQETVNVD